MPKSKFKTPANARVFCDNASQDMLVYMQEEIHQTRALVVSVYFQRVWNTAFEAGRRHGEKMARKFLDGLDRPRRRRRR